MFAHSYSSRQSRVCWCNIVRSAKQYSLQMMTEGHSGKLLVSESDWKSVPSWRSRSSKTTRTEADGPGYRNYQVTTNVWAQITTAGVLRNWLTHGDQVTRCDAEQTVEHQDTQLVGNALMYWQPVQNNTKRVRNAIKLSLSDDQSCRSIENSLDLLQMNVVCTPVSTTLQLSTILLMTKALTSAMVVTAVSVRLTERNCLR